MCFPSVVFQVNAALPFNSRGHGAPSLSLLQMLSASIHPKTETLWENEIPHLLSVLEGTETSKHHVCLWFSSCEGVCLTVLFPESTAESLDKKQWNEKLLKVCLLAAYENVYMWIFAKKNIFKLHLSNKIIFSSCLRLWRLWMMGDGWVSWQLRLQGTCPRTTML